VLVAKILTASIPEVWPPWREFVAVQTRCREQRRKRCWTCSSDTRSRYCGVGHSLQELVELVELAGMSVGSVSGSRMKRRSSVSIGSAAEHAGAWRGRSAKSEPFRGFVVKQLARPSELT